MNRFAKFAALSGALLLGACVGEKEQVQSITSPTIPSAAVRFFHFGLNAPGVNFYADATKMTAISSTTGTESTTGVAFNGVGSGGYYSALEPGSHVLTAKIAAATDKDLVIASVTSNIEANKKYSFYMSGVYNTTAKTVEAFVVEDPIPATFDYANATVRFVNAINNSSPMTLYVQSQTAGSAELAIGADVAYKAAGAFTTIPGGVYDLRTRVAGSATNVITRTGVSFVAGKVYTITAKGDINVTTGTNARALDNTANR